MTRGEKKGVARKTLSEDELKEIRSSLSNMDLKRLIEVASSEVQRRRFLSLDVDDDPENHVPKLDVLMQESLKTFGNNFLLAFNVRAGVALLLRIFALIQRRRGGSLISFQDLVGEESLKYRVDAVRLGLFVGSLTGGFQFSRGLLQALRRKDDGYNSLIAGTLASLSFFFVDKSRRRTMALYIFARVAQGLYNASKSRGWFHFWGSHWPHGDALLFIVSSAMIMYAYVMRPEALPFSYWKFIVNTGPIPANVLECVRQNNRGQPIDLPKIVEYIKKHAPNLPVDLTTTHPAIIPCSVLHPGRPCSSQMTNTFSSAFGKVFPLYLSLTLVPAIVLRVHRFRRAPLSVLLQAFSSAVQSTAFLSSFPTLYMLTVCFHRKLFSTDHRSIYFVAGLVASLSIFIERKSRRAELALYAMPRAADTLFFILEDRRWLKGLPYGEELLFILSMGGLLYLHQHEPDTLSPLFRKLMNIFIPQRAKPDHSGKIEDVSEVDDESS